MDDEDEFDYEDGLLKIENNIPIPPDEKFGYADLFPELSIGTGFLIPDDQAADLIIRYWQEKLPDRTFTATITEHGIKVTRTK
jgi:hypothetical protein